MSEKLLDVKNLEVIYETDTELVNAVNNISFTLNKGESLGIVGETGAGKTTTALALMRLLQDGIGSVSGGTIDFCGKDLLNISEVEMREMIRGERISMIFQDPMTSLNPVLTVGDQIAEALIYHNKDKLSKSEIDKIVDETLELVGIPASRKNEYPHQFSGGMKQRVVIAIALACKPELLIADEPTTALDVTIQAQVLAMMSDLREKLGMAMIMITHDLGIIVQICDKVAVMYAGEFIETGTVEDIYTSKNRHPYTVGLFGSIPNINVDTDRLTAIEGLTPDPTSLPKGCKFSPRCPKCMDICMEVQPEAYVDGTHSIVCHLFKNKEEE
ncbi:MAG: ABC transporter ATP-binding protein [Sedimentibacter sp.]